MRTILTTIVALLMSSGIWAQSIKEQRADEYFKQHAYIKAAALYEEVKAKKKGHIDLMLKLADCYRYLQQSEKAEAMYKQALDQGGHRDAETLYYYAEMLKYNGKYNVAEQWMEKYYARLGKVGDSTDTDMSELVAQLKSDPERYKIEYLTVNGPYRDFSPVMLKDKVVFVSSRDDFGAVHRRYSWDDTPFFDFYVANKEPDGSLSNLEKFSSKVETKFHEGPLCFSADGNTMYFTRNNFLHGRKPKNERGINNLKIFSRTWNDKHWGQEKELDFCSNEYTVAHPTISSDGRTLFFVSDMQGGAGGTDLYSSTLGDDGSWGEPQNIVELNTEGNEMFPFVHEDGTLFFASDGHPGLGGLDIFMAYPSKHGFEEPQNLGFPLNDSRDDFGLFVHKDYKYGYFSSNRPGGKGEDDIYKVVIKKPFGFRIKLTGKVLDHMKELALAGAELELYDEAGDKLETVDVNQAYGVFVEPGQVYTLKATLPGYYANSIEVSTKDLSKSVREINTDIRLLEDIGFSFKGVVTDAKTGETLDSVRVVVFDNLMDENALTAETVLDGTFKAPMEDKKLGQRVSYQIKLERPGYLSKTVTFNTKLEEQQEFQWHELLDLTLGKIEKGADIGKLLNLAPIYFDYNSYEIRKDAASELDKIVKAMQDNPTMRIELGSHTDSRGKGSYNLRLSDKRAKASASYIISQGISSLRIYGKGYGESRLINSCDDGVNCSEEEHSLNRRTEFIIVQM